LRIVWSKRTGIETVKNQRNIMKIRLLKVAVQATVVLDDGEHLQEAVFEPTIVTAAKWREFADASFKEAHMQELMGLVEKQMAQAAQAGAPLAPPAGAPSTLQTPADAPAGEAA
jgi:putative copper export protein